MMAFVQNVPFFSIMISMLAGIVSSILPAKTARKVNVFAILSIGTLSVWLLSFLLQSDLGYYTYMMGHFPAPWGNEIRAGVLEVLMAIVFCVVMLLSLMGGLHKIAEEIEPTKEVDTIGIGDSKSARRIVVCCTGSARFSAEY